MSIKSSSLINDNRRRKGNDMYYLRIVAPIIIGIRTRMGKMAVW